MIKYPAKVFIALSFKAMVQNMTFMKTKKFRKSYFLIKAAALSCAAALFISLSGELSIAAKDTDSLNAKLSELVNVNIRDADVRHVMNLIGVRSGISISYPENLEGNVDLKLNMVRLATALDAILSQAGAKWKPDKDGGSRIYVVPEEAEAREIAESPDTGAPASPDSALRDKLAARVTLAFENFNTSALSRTFSNMYDINVALAAREKATLSITVEDASLRDVLAGISSALGGAAEIKNNVVSVGTKKARAAAPEFVCDIDRFTAIVNEFSAVNVSINQLFGLLAKQTGESPDSPAKFNIIVKNPGDRGVSLRAGGMPVSALLKELMKETGMSCSSVGDVLVFKPAGRNETAVRHGAGDGALKSALERKLTLKYRNADIHSALIDMAGNNEMNMIISGHVGSIISTRLDGVTAAEALDKILEGRNAAWTVDESNCGAAENTETASGCGYIRVYSTKPGGPSKNAGPSDIGDVRDFAKKRTLKLTQIVQIEFAENDTRAYSEINGTLARVGDNVWGTDYYVDKIGTAGVILSKSESGTPITLDITSKYQVTLPSQAAAGKPPDSQQDATENSAPPAGNTPAISFCEFRVTQIIEAYDKEKIEFPDYLEINGHIINIGSLLPGTRLKVVSVDKQNTLNLKDANSKMKSCAIE